MKYFYLILMLSFITATGKTQVIKKTVALSAVSFSKKSANNDIAESLHSYILNSMLQSPRLTVVARRGAFSEITKEKELQTGVGFVDGEVVRQGKEVGAEYVIFVHINHAVANTIKNKDGELKGFEGDVSLFCRIVNVETTEIIASAIITPKGYEQLTDAMLNSNLSVMGQEMTGGISFSAYSQSPEQAVRQTMSQVEPNMEEFLLEVFPLEVMISDIQTNTTPKGKEETSVFITGGKQLGLNKGTTLDVKQIVDRDINGQNFQEEISIGKIKVIRVSENLITCKILSDVGFLENSFLSNRESIKAVQTTNRILNFKF